MSIVAGVVLRDRVVMYADTRLTCYPRGPRGPAVPYDNLLKVFPCGTSVVGYATNDVVGTGAIIHKLLKQVSARPLIRRAAEGRRPGLVPLRQEVLRLARWLPRLLRAQYRARGMTATTSVMFGYAVPGVMSRIHTDQLFALAMRGAREPWMAAVAMASGGRGWVCLPGTWAPRLLVMQSPLFVPRTLLPLAFEAIGDAGSMTRTALDEDAALVLGEDLLQGIAMDYAVSHV